MISVALILLGGLLARLGLSAPVSEAISSAVSSLVARLGPELQNKVTTWLWGAVKSEGPAVARALLASILSSGAPTDVLEWCQQRHAELEQDGPADVVDPQGP